MTNVKFYIDLFSKHGKLKRLYDLLRSCHPDYVKDLATATFAEYSEILNELKGQGYDDLFIINNAFKACS